MKFQLVNSSYKATATNNNQLTTVFQLRRLRTTLQRQQTRRRITRQRTVRLLFMISKLQSNGDLRHQTMKSDDDFSAPSSKNGIETATYAPDDFSDATIRTRRYITRSVPRPQLQLDGGRDGRGANPQHGSRMWIRGVGAARVRPRYWLLPRTQPTRPRRHGQNSVGERPVGWEASNGPS